MIFPKNLKLNDVIGVTAPSAGISKEEKLLRLDAASRNIKKIGFKFLETKNVRTCENGRSSSGKMRAKQFMDLWDNPEVGAIIMATGGDFLVEMLEYMDWDKIKSSEAKWIQGYSDITGLTFIITTMLDIATIYGDNIKSYGMRELYKNLTDSIEIMKGKDVLQESFEKCEGFFEEENEGINKEIDPYSGYLLNKENKWKLIDNKYENTKFTGRSIGGCFDVIVNLIGTKYDKIKEYIEKYKEDGIIWFFDIYEMTSPQIYLHLWQMKNARIF